MFNLAWLVTSGTACTLNAPTGFYVRIDRSSRWFVQQVEVGRTSPSPNLFCWTKLLCAHTNRKQHAEDCTLTMHDAHPYNRYLQTSV